MDRVPWFQRKTNRKTSHLQWSDGTLSSSDAAKLSARLERVYPELRQMFESNRERLPRKTELGCGGCHGAWVYCPNDLAEEVERIIKAAQASVAK